MKLSSQNRTALDFILWTLLAILLGLILPKIRAAQDKKENI